MDTLPFHSSRSAAPRTPAREPIKFLLVDDREENLIALEALLRRDGLQTLLARSGEQALELLLVHDVALALLDVQMPEMDGFALAELMRGSERTRLVPIIFVTAGVHDQSRVFEGYDAGAVDFLSKPVDPRILRHKAQVFFDLYEQRQKLAETLRMNETFIAAIGHDLRNPLNAILISVELLLKQRAEAQASPRTLERIRSSAKRMSAMIDDLFDLARSRSGGGIPIDPVAVDLVPLVQSVIEECATKAPGRTVELTHRGNTLAHVDVKRMEQVVSNLVGNAFRHSQPESPIDVLLEERGGIICLSVHNVGAIAPEILPQLFHPFRSGRSDPRSGDGLGLGLFIVERIVLAHQGSIEVRSDPANGTTFSVHFPRNARPSP